MSREFTAVLAQADAISLRFPAGQHLRLEAVIAHIFSGAVRAITDVRARWIDCAPVNKRRIYFANHTSHLDFLLLWSVLPAQLRRTTQPVAACDYWKRCAIRSYLAERVFHSVFVERGEAELASNPAAPMLDALQQGKSLVVFPEGTRGGGEKLLPFKSGVFHVAREMPGVELVPVWITNAHRVMPKGTLLPIPMLCTVTFGAPTHIEDNEEKPEFLGRLRRHLLHMSTV